MQILKIFIQSALAATEAWSGLNKDANDTSINNIVSSESSLGFCDASFNMDEVNVEEIPKRQLHRFLWIKDQWQELRPEIKRMDDEYEELQLELNEVDERYVSQTQELKNLMEELIAKKEKLVELKKKITLTKVPSTWEKNENSYEISEILIKHINDMKSKLSTEAWTLKAQTDMTREYYVDTLTPLWTSFINASEEEYENEKNIFQAANAVYVRWKNEEAEMNKKYAQKLEHYNSQLKIYQEILGLNINETEHKLNQIIKDQKYNLNLIKWLEKNMVHGDKYLQEWKTVCLNTESYISNALKKNN